MESHDIEAHHGNECMVVLAMVKHFPWSVCAWIGKEVCMSEVESLQRPSQNLKPICFPEPIAN
jgi:hypothetical protein